MDRGRSPRGRAPRWPLDPGALPGHLDPTGTSIMPADVIAGTAHTVVVPLLHGPMGEDGTVQGLLELANIPYVGLRRARLGAGDGQGDGQAGAGGQRHRPGPLPRRFGRTRSHRACLRRSPRSSACRCSSSRPTWVRRSACRRPRPSRPCATRSTARLTYDEWVVVEEAIVGREIEVAVLGNLEPRASVPGEIVPGAEFYDYADKYLDDGSQTLVPAPLTPEQSDDGAGHGGAGLHARCVAKAWRASTSSSKSTAAASCATRSTRCPASRRSRCTRRCGSPAGCRTPN